MLTYTIEDAICEMADNAGVMRDGYGTWKCEVTLGWRDENAYDYFTTHDESWKTGEFDGKKYNEQDFDEWLEDYFEHEFGQLSQEALALITEEMKEQMFENWCKVLWLDSANESNYEPSELRYRRIAERIFDSWEKESAPDNVFICREKDKVVVLSDDEMKFVNSKCDEGDNSYYEELCGGVTTRFLERLRRMGRLV